MILAAIGSGLAASISHNRPVGRLTERTGESVDGIGDRRMAAGNLLSVVVRSKTNENDSRCFFGP